MKIAVNGTTVHASPAPARRMSPRAKVMTTAMAMAMSCVSPFAFAQSNAISPGYLTGVWKDNAQCGGNEAMVFFPNNTMSSAGSVPVNYSVTGPAQFTMHGPGGVVPIQAQRVNQNQMVVTFQNSAVVVYRCGGANAAGNPAQLTVTYIVGGWTHNGNCSAPEAFLPGGRFRTSNQAVGTWSLSGNVLRMVPSNGAGVIDFSVQANSLQNMTLTQHNNGQVSHYTRCY